MSPGSPEGEPAAAGAGLPRRVVALGGGSGLPAVLRGLRRFATGGELSDLIAVVAMSDDGGSSGRLRRGRGLPPPGDVRNCLVALAEEEDLLSALFQHRYDGDGELGGHNLGNLILAALAEQTGSFLKAVEVSGLVLRIAGRILPVTTDDVTLTARLEDGSEICGESTIGSCRKPIRSVALHPATARPTPGVVEAIRGADLIVLGPGSLFTSVVPNLVVEEVAQALRGARGVRALVANLVSERGEAPGLTLESHLQVIEEHAGGRVVDVAIVHDGPVAADTLRRYHDEGSNLLAAAGPVLGGRPVVRRNLLADGDKLRHDPVATADALLEAWRTCRAASGALNRA